MTLPYRFLLLLATAIELFAQDPTQSLAARHHVAAAQELQRQNNLVSAEREFRSAITEARLIGPESTVLANALDAMGAFYGDIGNFDKAEHCFVRSLAIWRQLLGSDHFAIARVISKLASLYLETDQRAKAERLELPVWIARVEASEPSSPDLIHLLGNLAALNVLRRQYSEAENLYLRVLDLIRKREPSDSAERAMVLNNLGVMCMRSKRYDDAIEYLSRSLDIWQRLRGPDDPNAGLTSQALALAYQQVGRSDEAGPLLQHALSIAEKSFGPESIRTAAILQSYAFLLREHKRKGEAKILEGRVQRIIREAGQSLPSRHIVDIAALREQGLR